jgi:hypothetical protein
MTTRATRTLARVTVDLELEYDTGAVEAVDWAIRRAVDEAAASASGCEVLHAVVTIDPLG